MSNAKLTAVRLPEALVVRIEEIAKAQRIKFSAAMRIALQRGVAAIEREAEAPPGEPASPSQRRRVISKGVI